MTGAGLAAVRRIDPAHTMAARALADEVGHGELARTVEALVRLSAAMEVLAPDAAVHDAADDPAAVS